MDIAQLGLDPATDAGEAGLVAADVAEDSDAAAAEDEAADSCEANSFAAATLVVLASAKTGAISKLKIGTKVRSVDPATGKQVTVTVGAKYLNIDRHFTNLTFTSVTKGHRSSITMHTTSGHRIWDATAKTFVYAADLRVDHKVRTSGKAVWTLASAKSWNGTEAMYDITINSCTRSTSRSPV